jgi:pyruvate dehydrogenase E2 component (dihydrolipoamide acetyltransferase)
MNVTTQQLAELLIGIARSQQAIIDAVDAQKAGFKGTYLTPALDSVAKIRSTGRAPSLQEFPARVLSQCQSRVGPNLEQVVKDLEALLSGQVAVPAAVAPAAARAAAAAPAPAAAAPAPAAQPAAAPAPAGAGDNDLDMTRT